MAQRRRWRWWLATPCHICHQQYILVLRTVLLLWATSVELNSPGATGQLLHGVAIRWLRGAVKQGARAGICNTVVTSAISGEKACFTTVQTTETINSTTKDSIKWRQEGRVTWQPGKWPEINRQTGMTAHAGEIVAARSKIYKCCCLHLYTNCSHPDRVQRGTVGAYYGHRWHILISLLGVLRHIWFKIIIEFVNVTQNVVAECCSRCYPWRISVWKIDLWHMEHRKLCGTHNALTSWTWAAVHVSLLQ